MLFPTPPKMCIVELTVGKPLGRGMHASVFECTTDRWPMSAIKLPLGGQVNKRQCHTNFHREWCINEILILATVLAPSVGEEEENMRMHCGYNSIVRLHARLVWNDPAEEELFACGYTHLQARQARCGEVTSALLMEQCSFTSLRDFLMEVDIIHDAQATRDLFKAAFAGIRYMAYCGRVRHQDVHWGNLLRGQQQDGWKFIDFGAATIIQDPNQACALDITAFVQTLFVNMSPTWVYTFTAEEVPHFWALLYELAMHSPPAFFQTYDVPAKQHAQIRRLQTLLFTDEEERDMAIAERNLQHNAARMRRIDQVREELPPQHFELNDMHRVTLAQRGYV